MGTQTNMNQNVIIVFRTKISLEEVFFFFF